MAKLNYITLCNFQSFYDEVIFELVPGLNIFEGRSEIGKSILAKVLRKMCCPGFYDRNSEKSLISRNKDMAYAIFSYDTVKIKFELYPTYQIYRLLDSHGEEIQSWKQNECPSEILRQMGLFVDVDAGYLLNIIDQEMGQLFITTPGDLNARVLAFVTIDEDLKICEINLTDWITKLDESKKIETRNVSILQKMNQICKYTDIGTFKDILREKKLLLPILQFMVKVMAQLCEMHRALPCGFKYVDNTIMESILASIEGLQCITTCIDEFMLIENKEFIRVDREIIEGYILTIEEMLEICKAMGDFLEIPHDVLRFKKVDHDTIKKCLEIRGNCAIVYNSLGRYKELLGLQKRFRKIDKGTMGEYLTALGEIQNLRKLLEQYNGVVSNINIMSACLAKSKEKRVTFERLYGFCPLCGSKFREVEQVDNTHECSRPYEDVREGEELREYELV